jgi:hypothetical protein
MDKEKNTPSEKAKAIVDGLVIIISFLLLNFYLSDIKSSIDCMTQDYPSFGLNFISRWVALFIPFPSAIYLLWKEVSILRKPMKYLGAIAILLVIIGILRVLSAEEISFEMSMWTFGIYIISIIFGAFLICPWTTKRLGRFVDWLLKTRIE